MNSRFASLFDLRLDQSDPATIDHAVRSGVRAVGTNLWVLIFAILIASVGLNVNATAVIIGAMLISPLMGPIIGIGYGAGINDFPLIRLAVRNLLLFSILSLVTSTLYFVLSPLDHPQSELLARTSPTLWDVLIAFFGGAAGIVALSRKEISNVVPGVAIATALMPPLCTAGFGIAQKNWEFFAGAFFLFTINSVFIALATLLFVKILKLPVQNNVDADTRRWRRWLIASVTLAVIVPSAYLGYRVVQADLFKNAADSIVAELNQNNNVMVLSSHVEADKHLIALTVAGNVKPEDLEKAVSIKMKNIGIAETKVQIRQWGSNNIDAQNLRRQLRDDLYGNSLKYLDGLVSANRQLEQENTRLKQANTETDKLIGEIRAHYPEISTISVSSGRESTSASAPAENLTIVTLRTSKRLPKRDEDRLRQWLTARLSPQRSHVVVLRHG